MSKITNIKAREIFNGLWEPTLQVTVEVEGGISGVSAAPTGQSTGMYEAVELRDGGDRLDGRGCLKAVAMVEGEIRERLAGMDVTDQAAIDMAMKELDGTVNKSRLGGNSTSAVSAAVTAAAAKSEGLPVYKYISEKAHILPVPMIDMISGSHYSYGASSEIQEFSVLPIGAETFAEAMDISRKLYVVLRENIIKKFGPLGQCVDAAGSFAIPVNTCRETLDFLMLAVKKSGFEDKFRIGMDCAASGWYDKDKGVYKFEGEERTAHDMLDYYKKLVADYPVISLEDPFDENDVEGFCMATDALGIQIVGDDFFVTNTEVMKEKMARGAANALLWKYNQVGTLTEAYAAAEMAVKGGYGLMPSGRSGECEDDILADLLVGLNAGQSKVGIPVRSENTAKYNRLLCIEEELGSEAVYAGYDFRKPGFDK